MPIFLPLAFALSLQTSMQVSASRVSVEPSAASCDAALYIIDHVVSSPVMRDKTWGIDGSIQRRGPLHRALPAPPAAFATEQEKPFVDLLKVGLNTRQSVTACQNVRDYMKNKNMPVGRPLTLGKGFDALLVVSAPVISEDGHRAVALVEKLYGPGSHGGSVMLERDGNSWREVGQYWNVHS